MAYEDGEIEDGEVAEDGEVRYSFWEKNLKYREKIFKNVEIYFGHTREKISKKIEKKIREKFRR